MLETHFILGAEWLLYCFFHSFLADVRVKAFAARQMNISVVIYRVFYNIIALLGLALLFYLHTRVSSLQLYTPNLLSAVTALLMIGVGLTVMLLCILKYFKQLSGIFKESKKGKLQTNGLHRWVRHPLYTGTFIFLAGLVLYWPLYKNAMAVLILILYTIAGTWLEEKKLVLQFGEDYKAYQRKVPMMIPGWKRDGLGQPVSK